MAIVLGYKDQNDWYSVTSSRDIINNCGGTLLGNYYNNSPQQFLRAIFPEYDWIESKFVNYKTETKLYKTLLPLYPTIIHQFKQDWCMKKTYLKFDFCIPEHNIIIELDGPQHFIQVSNWSSPQEQFENDKFKEKCANENSYSVIRILQEDVLLNKYEWVKELCDTIEEIKNGDEIVNVYLCKNGEYDTF